MFVCIAWYIVGDGVILKIGGLTLINVTGLRGHL